MFPQDSETVSSTTEALFSPDSNILFLHFGLELKVEFKSPGKWIEEQVDSLIKNIIRVNDAA